MFMTSRNTKIYEKKGNLLELICRGFIPSNLSKQTATCTHKT